MSTHVEELHEHGPGIPTFAKVWIALLVLTGAEVFLAYEQVPLLIMLTVLLGLSVIKAALVLHQQVLPPLRGTGVLRPELAGGADDQHRSRQQCVDIGHWPWRNHLEVQSRWQAAQGLWPRPAAYSSGANRAASRREQPADRRVDQRRRGVRF